MCDSSLSLRLDFGYDPSISAPEHVELKRIDEPLPVSATMSSSQSLLP